MYRFFSINEPDSGTQNCVAYVSNGPGFWVDDTCTTLHPYVCERCKFVKPKKKKVCLSFLGAQNPKHHAFFLYPQNLKKRKTVRCEFLKLRPGEAGTGFSFFLDLMCI